MKTLQKQIEELEWEVSHHDFQYNNALQLPKKLRELKISLTKQHDSNTKSPIKAR